MLNVNSGPIAIDIFMAFGSKCFVKGRHVLFHQKFTRQASTRPTRQSGVDPEAQVKRTPLSSPRSGPGPAFLYTVRLTI